MLLYYLVKQKQSKKHGNCIFLRNVGCFPNRHINTDEPSFICKVIDCIYAPNKTNKVGTAFGHLLLRMLDVHQVSHGVLWLHGTVVERRSFTGKLPCPTLDLS